MLDFMTPTLHQPKLAVTALLIAVLAGCTTTPLFDTQQVDTTLTPREVIQDPELSRGNTVLWGGMILDTRNQTHATQIEVLAYPLNSSQRPMAAAPKTLIPGEPCCNYSGVPDPTSARTVAPTKDHSQ